MNDDWDGVDWAEHFSGPDDDEIERAQESAYQSSSSAEDDEDSDIADFEYNSNDAVSNNPITHSESKPADIAHDYGFDNFGDVKIFTNYARKIGAKNIRVRRHDLQPRDFVKPVSSHHGSCPFSVSLEAPVATEFSFYRSGLRYHDNEKKEIIESYLSWTPVDQIANRHKRTPSGISSLLQKEGLIFLYKVYPKPEGWDEDAPEHEGFWACENLKTSIEDGSCPLSLASFLKLQSAASEHENFYINDLPEADKRKLIAFAAKSISLDSGKRLARALNQWSLLYFLALQSRDVLCGFEALDRKAANLSANLEKLRFEIKCYLRSRAVETLRIPLLNWIQHADVRYNPSHVMQNSFNDAIVDFQKLYEASSPTRGFGDQSKIRLIVALLGCDFESVATMARAGNSHAMWYCCDWVVASINAGGIYRCDSSWARATDALNVDHAELLNSLHASLSFDPALSLAFANRIGAQAEMGVTGRVASELNN